MLPDPRADALLAARLLAVDPAGLGGVRLRAAADARREHRLAALRAALPGGRVLPRLPLHVDDDRLLGGLDLGATVQAGRAVMQPGLLARCDGGVQLVAMAERLPAATAARLAAVLDSGQVLLQRDGLTATAAARLGLVALDEAVADEEVVPAALTDRLAMVLDLRAMPAWRQEPAPPAPCAAAVMAARARLPGVVSDDRAAQVLCAAADALGVDSLRAPLFALRVARAAAAWAGRSAVQAGDLALAARLVLAPRATRLPVPPEEAAPPEPEPPAEPPPLDDSQSRDDDDAAAQPDAQTLQDQVLQAALAAIPPGLLVLLASGIGARQGAGGRGRCRPRTCAGGRTARAVASRGMVRDCT